MKKFFFLILSVLLVLPFLCLGGAFFYLKSHSEEYLQIGLQKAKAEGIEISYVKNAASSAFFLSLKEFKIGGSRLPYKIQSTELSLGPSLNASWPPLKILLKLSEPELEINSEYQVPEAPIAPPKATQLNPVIVSLASLAMGLSQLQLSILNANAAFLGIKGASLNLNLKNLALKSSGVKHAILTHELVIKEFNPPAKFPLPGIFSKGTFLYDSPTVQISDHLLSFGPINIQSTSKLNLESQKWNIDLLIPESNLGAASSTLKTELIPWLKKISGIASLKASVQGLGPDLSAINVDGHAALKQIALEVYHPEIKGNCKLEFDSTFSKGKSLSLKVQSSIDLTQTSLQKENLFLKEIGIPLQLEFNLTGNDKDFEITKAQLKFHNLSASGSGIFNQGPQTIANIRIAVQPTDLEGWEKFFPQYKEIKTRGLLSLQTTYIGALQDWKSSTIDLNLKAKELRLPILKSWIPLKDLQFEGISHINSDTQISYSKGSLKTLSTNTLLDFRENHITYSDTFNKPQKTPFSLDLSILSTGSKASIKRGDISLGNMKGHLKGVIENFNAPLANLKFESEKLNIEDWLTLSPTSQQKSLANLRGYITTKFSVTGPLTQANIFPKIQGDAQLAKISFDYLAEGAQKKIQLLNLSGALIYTNDSINAKKLLLSFPATDLLLDLQLKSFSEPQINFNLSGSRLALSDFMDVTANGGQGGRMLGAGGIPVPVALPSSTKNESAEKTGDFRSNPYMKSTRLSGTLNLRSVNLGYTKADSIIGKVDYDKLLLHISPMSLKIFNGMISSTTVWNGRTSVPTTNQNVRIEGVDANSFLSSASESAKDLIEGKLSADLKFSASGMETSELKKSATGEGNFSLSEGRIKSVRFTQKPLENLKKLPFFSRAITRTDWDEKLNQAKGNFKFSDGKFFLSNLVLHSPYFDATTNEATLDLDQKLNAKIIFIPKDSLIPSNYLEALKDGSGQPNIPLVIAGPIRNPSVNLDDSVIEGRIKAYASRKLEEESKKALNEAKNKAQQELENRLKQGLGGLFK